MNPGPVGAGEAPRLLLMRHAKSSWEGDWHLDHDRPLNDRGRRDAARIGRALETLGWRPRQIFHSTAVRARDTATILAATAGWENLPREAVDGLYGADSATAMELIGTRAGGGQALFIGHQPVLSALVEDWTGMRHGSVPMPTSAVALLVRSGDPSPAAPYRLERLLTPRDLDPG